MNRTSLNSGLQVLAGILLVAVGAFLLMTWVASERIAHMPAGRSILRPPQDVQCLAQVDETVWVGGKEGLVIFSVDGSPQPIPAPLRGLHFVSALLHESDGGVWVAHEDGMTYWKSGSVKHFSTQTGAFPGRALAVLRDLDGTLWAGSDQSLSRLEGDVFRPVAMPDSFGLTEAAVLYQDRAGTLWIGDSSPRSPGLIRFDARGFRLFTQRDGLPHLSINTIMQVGGSSALWVGTGFAGSGGAVLITNDSLRTIGRQHGLAGDKVRTIFEDSSGRQWFGSEYDGVAIFADTRLTIIDEAGGLAGPEVKAILEYPPNTFWLGTNGGLSRIEHLETQSGDPRFPGFGSTPK